MKTLFYLFLGVLILLGGFIIFQLWSGRVTPRLVKRIRAYRLEQWKEAVEQELSVSQDFHECLYNIYERNGDRSLLFSPTNKESRRDFSVSNFYDSIDYALYHDKNKWYIIEKKTDRIYPYHIMIDEKGNLYEIRCLPKDN